MANPLQVVTTSQQFGPLSVLKAPQQQPLSVLQQPKVQQPLRTTQAASQAPLSVSQSQQQTLRPGVFNADGSAYKRPLQMDKIASDINVARGRGANDETIIQAMVQKNPDLLPNVQEAAQRGAGASQILDAIVNKYTPTPAKEEKKTIGGFAKNVLSSTGELFKNLGTAAIHPIKTLDTLSATISGGLKLGANKLGENYDTNAPDVKTAQAVGQFYKDRYGGWQNIKNTLYNDPAGAALDASMLLDAGSSAVGKIADLTKIGGLAKTADVLGSAAKYTNPFNAAGKSLGMVNRGAQELSGAITGTGYGAIKEGLNAAEQGGKARQAFTQALRGNTTGEDIVTAAKENLGAVKNAKNTSYRKDLKTIQQIGSTLDTTPIKNKLAQSLDDFGIKLGVDKNGKPVLNFKTSVVSDPTEQARVKRIFNDVSTWKDNTPAGLDILKRRIASEFSQSSDVRALTQGLKLEVSNLLKDKVPGYQKMVTDYSQASDLIDEMQKALSISDKASMDTGIRKLTSILRQNNELRLELVKRLEQVGGKQLVPQIAGTAFNSWLPRGILRPILAGEGLLHAGNLGKVASVFPALLLTSPRIVGEFLNVLGSTKGVLKASKAAKVTTPALKLGTQVNKATTEP